MVSTILIDTEKAMVGLYCVEHDLLLISEAFYWVKDDTFYEPRVLWAMINHRFQVVIIF